MSEQENLPIIIGVGQVVDHWDGKLADNAPHPVGIISQAISRALADTNIEGIAEHLDCAVIVRTFPDSLPRRFDPFGVVKNMASAVMKRSNLNIENVIYSTPGGDQPQALVNELSAKLFHGKISAALIAGGEVTGAMKAALKSRTVLDWASDEEGPVEERGAKREYITEYEIRNGLGMPPQTYAAMDQALRGRLGLSKNDYAKLVGEVYAAMSEVAAQNPHAQFPTARSAEFISSPSKENYRTFDSYLKWHMAQDSVNQGAALILTTVGKAKAIGVAPEKWIYLHGHADIKDTYVSERPNLSHSDAIRTAIDKAIEASGITAKQIAHRDIYSCFPVVMLLAAEYLGLNPKNESMTVTGGLSFFGGAGNNYSTHAIASMTERLRTDRDQYGLILANGGFMNKESVGVYSAVAPKSWTPVNCDGEQANLDARPDVTLLEEDCSATIDAYCLKHGRYGPTSGYVVAHNSEGRIVARLPRDHRATMSALSGFDQPTGQTVKIQHKDNINTVVNTHPIGAPMSDDFLAREFKYVSLKRDGNILEVTLNRPESYNALFSAAHFELAEIFDEFEADKDLWVAIVTGAGEKAFCSGNDLKVTASGGDMSTPDSGFAGLCKRTNREKPVIAAVNGVAMGGGLEIVLACDIAIAEPTATMALPEVKVGLFAAAGGVQRLTRQIGEKAAMELILTGRKISAEEASELGLVNSVSAPGKVLEEAWALAETIASNSPTSVRASKRVLNAVDDLGNWDKALELSNAEIVKLLQSKDAREGVTAFAQKRKPNWVNG